MADDKVFGSGEFGSMGDCRPLRNLRQQPPGVVP
jgi:hypothetical protein